MDHQASCRMIEFMMTGNDIIVCNFKVNEHGKTQKLFLVLAIIYFINKIIKNYSSKKNCNCFVSAKRNEMKESKMKF